MAWKVTETGAAHFASSASTASNVIGCDKSLVSVSAASGGLYGYAGLSSDAFSLVGCITAPVALPGGRPGVLVADDTQVIAFATVARTAPATKPDGLGRWGALTAHACEAPDTVHMLYALNHGAGKGLGWTLLKGGARTCTWHSPSSFPVAQTGVLASLRPATYGQETQRGVVKTSAGTAGTSRRFRCTVLRSPPGRAPAC